ncbi:MAG: Crp/Fnr family transcriptional regulator [Eubacteriales bacterium]|nr:Crp/Fnr family transcriptional regulator [Eubacteriales bacterium]
MPAIVFLLDGSLDIYTSNGVLFSTLKSGDFFEPVSIFSQIKPLLPLYIRARTNCIVTTLDKAILLPMFDRDPVLSRNYMKLSADKLQNMLCRLEHFTAATPSVALSLYLLRNHTHNTLKLPDGFAGLARRLNISRATLYRALSELEQLELVSHHEKTIRILDHQGLFDFVRSHAQPSAEFLSE